MNYLSNPHIEKKVAELSELLAADTNSPPLDRSLIVKAMRLLRPSAGISADKSHVAAIRAKLRQSLLNNIATQSSNASDGQLLLSKFDRHCDNIRRANPQLINPVLMLLEPLSFHKIINNSNNKSMSLLSRQQESIEESGENAFTDAIKHIYPTSERKESGADNNPAFDRPIGSLQPKAAIIEEHEKSWISRKVELKLMTDLIFILQGIPGKHIKFDSRSESYVIDPSILPNNAPLPGAARDVVLCMCELGWLYSRVHQYLQRTLNEGSAVRAEGRASKGLVVQAFACALQEELQDYFRLLTVLEQELNRTKGSQLTSVENAMSINSHKRIGNENNATESFDEGGVSGLTLLRLRAWLQEPLERMCMMARLVDGASDLTGGALASRMFKHTQHGDPANRQLLGRVMLALCAPLYHILTRWLLHGELQDPHEEFFIRFNGSVNNLSGGSPVVRSVWRDTYVLEPKMLPPFFSPLLASKILNIGKSINFIRSCLQKLPRIDTDDLIAESSNSDAMKQPADKKNKLGRSYRAINKSKALTINAVVIDNEESGNKNSEPQGTLRSLTITEVLAPIITPRVNNSLNKLKYGGESALTDVVLPLSSAIDSKLMHIMNSRFYTAQHLLALKKFMLLGQGDFVTCLMDGVGPELKKRANQLYRHNLTGILEGALRSSNAQYEPNYILDRIGIRLLEAAPGDSGWEVFSLDYAVDFPLNAVVHMDALSQYRVAFHMLWRLKRVEWSLAATWKVHNMFANANRTEVSPLLRPVLHRCNLNRATMMHVVNNLCAFLMFEVMETAWINLQDAIGVNGKAQCMDDVIAAHDRYLAEILDRALLSPKHEQLNMQVQQLLQTILRFCSLEENLIADMMASVARKRVAKVAAAERSKKGQWGHSSYPEVEIDSEGTIDGIPEYVVKRLDEAVKEYGKQFDTLMFMLKEQREKVGEFVRHLAFRLDFNDFHQQRVTLNSKFSSAVDLDYGISMAQGDIATEGLVRSGIGLTSTPPAFLNNSKGHFFPYSDNNFSTEDIDNRQLNPPRRSSSPT